MARKLKGKRTFTAVVNGDLKTFKWSTGQERDAIMNELRDSGLLCRTIAKAFEVSEQYVQFRTGHRPKRNARYELKVRADIYDIAVRYALRNGMMICDATAQLIIKGAEALDFKVDP